MFNCILPKHGIKKPATNINTFYLQILQYAPYTETKLSKQNKASTELSTCLQNVVQ